MAQGGQLREDDHMPEHFALTFCWKNLIDNDTSCLRHKYFSQPQRRSTLGYNLHSLVVKVLTAVPKSAMKRPAVSSAPFSQFETEWPHPAVRSARNPLPI